MDVRKMETIFLVTLASVLPLTISAQCGSFEFASYYGSSMVLQRAPAQATVWGYTELEGTEVSLTMGANNYVTTSAMGPTGRPQWSVQIDSESGPGPFTIDATSGGCTISLTDVLFGDVYICSGQSNMVHRMDRLDDATPDIEDSIHYPNVRTFRTGNLSSDVPLYDLPANGIGQGWQAPDGGESISAFSAICFLFGRDLNVRLGVPIGLIQTTRGGTRIEAWSSPDALDVCFPEGVPPDYDKNASSVLWNAMIHPYLTNSIFGVLWYQGETNRHNPEDYSCALKNMVGDWRSKWFAGNNGSMNEVFPFGQVQLAPNEDVDRDTGFPDVRWAQTAEVGFTPNTDLVNVYTAVALDLPDFDSPYGTFHPRYKRPVSKRLTYGIYALGYNLGSETGPYQGPIPTSVVPDETIRLTYDDGTANLEQRATTGFEVCCDSSGGSERCPVSGVWTPAPVLSTANSVVELTNPCVDPEVVTGLRYLWRESPCALEQCAIYRVENELPAPPYTIDL